MERAHPIAIHSSTAIGSSPDIDSPPEVESDEQMGVHNRYEDSMTQGNAPKEDKSDDRVENRVTDPCSGCGPLQGMCLSD